MVKNIPIQATPALNLAATHSDFCSDFIIPRPQLSDEDILDLSTPREVTFPDSPDLPASDQFVYFHDFVQKGRIAAGTAEERLSEEEIRYSSKHVDTVVDTYMRDQPLEPIAPEDEVYLEAFLKSPYQQDIIQFFTNFAVPEPLKAKMKPLKLTYVEQQQIAQIKKRDRDRICRLASEGLTPDQIAQQFNLAYKPETIKHLIVLQKKHGNKLKFTCKGAKITPEVESAVLKIAADPDSAQLSLQEMEQRVSLESGLKIGSQTVSSILKSNGFAKKKPTFQVPEADCLPHKNCRIKVVRKLLEFLLEGREIVSIDETQCQAGFLRTSMWSRKGERCILPAGRKGKPVHVIAAIWRKGVIGYMLRDERIKANSHVLFLSRLYEELQKMEPEHYKDRFVILMDNAGAHKKRVVKDFIEAQGVPVLCNGPMTPHIQPIEYVFSLFKRELRRQKESGRDRIRMLVGIYRAWVTVAGMKTEIYNIYQHTFKFYKPILRYENISTGNNIQTSTTKVLNSYLKLSEKPTVPSIIDLD